MASESSDMPSPSSSLQTPAASGLEKRDKKTKQLLNNTSVFQLPPCRICGQAGNGLHYGVNTCHSCKIFFKRAQHVNERRACRRDPVCNTELGCKMCAYCRYEKCKMMGMSKGASKIGRYSYAYKWKNIREMSELMSNSLSKICIISSTNSQGPITGDVPLGSEMTRNTRSGHGWSISTNVHLEKSVSDLLEANKCNDYYQSVPIYGDNPMETLRQLHDPFREISGVDFSVSPEEYYFLRDSIGMEADKRQERIEQEVVKYESTLRYQIKFARTIPGFSALALEDQIELVKGSCFEYYMLCAFKAMDTDLKLELAPSGIIISFELMSFICDSQFPLEMVRYAQRLKKLDLYPQELAVLKAICITFADRVGDLKDREAVDRLQNKLVECLRYTLHRNRKNPDRFFARVISQMTSLRTLTAWDYRFTRVMLVKWPPLRGSTLMKETYDITGN